jgi:transposase
VLRRYKGQEVVERRYGNFKGPLAVAPMFLKSNRRIEALIALKLAALWAGRAAKPTGRLIFGALA